MEEFEFIKISASDPAGEALRQQYYALRTRAYQAIGKGGVYEYALADTSDRNVSTTHYFILKDSQVIAGQRVIEHCAGSIEKLNFETSYADIGLSKLLPGISIDQLNRAEIGGGVTAPEFQGSGLQSQLIEWACNDLKEYPQGTILIGVNANEGSNSMVRRILAKHFNVVARDDKEFTITEIGKHGTLRPILAFNGVFPFHGIQR